MNAQFAQDRYKSEGTLPEPARCPKCGASYEKGRWSWRNVPADAHRHVCPACQRLADNAPAGYVALKGEIVLSSRERIIEAVYAYAKAAGLENIDPLRRLVSVEDAAHGILVTTTDASMAYELALDLQDTFGGKLETTYDEGTGELRAVWTC